MRILVTGGCGYIGSHTLVDLLQDDYEVLCLDNLSRGAEKILSGVEQITGKQIQNHNIDLCDADATRNFFQLHKPDAVIHFAAYKSVGESVEQPLLYYHNNIASMVNLLSCVQEFDVKHFVFSSSCSVYGNLKTQPVNELTPLGAAISPYGHSKQIGEDMIRHFSKICSTRFVMLRYFNPVGAHPSALIGEIPFGKPSNLVPAITQSAAGILPAIVVHGNDYPTADGTCVRDYIHVCDIARAHKLALNLCSTMNVNENPFIMNLGSGNGNTVLEVIDAFEKSTGVKLNYSIGPRRHGDVDVIYSNNQLAKEKLGWQPEYSLADMMQSAWQWQLHLNIMNTK